MEAQSNIDSDVCVFKTQSDGCPYAALVLGAQTQKHLLSKTPHVTQQR